MAQRDSQVIGYFAYLSPMEVVCTGGDACVVQSEEDWFEYRIENHPEFPRRIQTARAAIRAGADAAAVMLASDRGRTSSSSRGVAFACRDSRH